MVKHLNSIEEQILESLAWTRDSALWTALQASENRVPTCEEVHYLFSPLLKKTVIFFLLLLYTEHCSNGRVYTEKKIWDKGKLFVILRWYFLFLR